jgi:hypothetical protein
MERSSRQKIADIDSFFLDMAKIKPLQIFRADSEDHFEVTA